MSERGRILVLSMVILVIVSLSATTLAIGVLYQATFEQHRDRLTRIVLHRAGILKTVTAFDTEVHEGETPSRTTAPGSIPAQPAGGMDCSAFVSG